MTRYRRLQVTCNQGWELLETPTAKRLRGGGWGKFSRAIIKSRGRCCEVCGVGGDKKHRLACHHMKTVRTHRHLRFETSNIVVVCPWCHSKMEHGKVYLLRMRGQDAAAD